MSEALGTRAGCRDGTMGTLESTPEPAASRTAPENLCHHPSLKP